MISKPNPRFKNEWVEDVVVRNNIFYDIKDLSDFEYDATAFYLGRGANIVNNIISNTATPIKYRNPKNKNIFESNIMINSKTKYSILNSMLEEKKNSTYLSVKESKKDKLFSFKIKQWTSPESIYFDDLPKTLNIK